MLYTHAPRHIRGIECGKTVFYIDDVAYQVTIEKYYMGNDYLNRINTDNQGEPSYMFILEGRTNYRLYSTAQGAKNAAKRVARKELA